MKSKIIYTGHTPGTLWTPRPMFELHQGGRFTCHASVEPVIIPQPNGKPPITGTRVNYAWSHGPFGAYDIPRVYSPNVRGWRRAVTYALTHLTATQAANGGNQ